MSYDSVELGHRLITLMAAAMLVVQMLLAGQRLLPTVIALFGLQSFFLACLAAAVAYVNHAPHVYLAAGLTLLLKVGVMPLLLQRIIRQTGTQVEVESYLNTPASILICGGLTLLGYMVAHPFSQPQEHSHGSLAVATALFLIGFFLMIQPLHRFLPGNREPGMRRSAASRPAAENVVAGAREVVQPHC
jgi:hydrogenase-4 component E